MSHYYFTQVKFESEDLLKDTDEYIPEYTAYLSCRGDNEGLYDFEINHIEDEEGREVPLKLFSIGTINYILDKACSKDWDKYEPDYD